MAAHYQEEVHVQNECENCGATEDLALCSRCHTAHFCSRKCQKAYWPFHREWCRRNDFADEVERTQPKFARFLRKHGKQAVLKDGACEPRLGERRAPRNPLDLDIARRVGSSRVFEGRAKKSFSRPAFEKQKKKKKKLTRQTSHLARFFVSTLRATDEVDRLERKVVSMPSMYGRANPKPEPPSYDAEDMRKMRAAEEKDLLRIRAAEAHASARSSGAFASSARVDASVAFAEIDVPSGLGEAVSETVKWRQNQTFVEIFVALPQNARGAADVKVRVEAERLFVAVAGATVLDGQTFAPIKAEASTWVVVDGVLELCLLKRFRRGNYENGKTNADTFWFSILRAEDGDEKKTGGERRDPGPVGSRRLALAAPPQAYYDSEYVRDPEGNEPPANLKVRKGGGGGRKRA